MFFPRWEFPWTFQAKPRLLRHVAAAWFVALGGDPQCTGGAAMFLLLPNSGWRDLRSRAMPGRLDAPCLEGLRQPQRWSLMLEKGCVGTASGVQRFSCVSLSGLE